MIALRIAACLLVLSGVFVLLFGGPGDNTEAVREAFSLSVWGGVAAILIGNTLLLLTRQKD